MRVGPVKNSCTLNLGTFQFKPLQGGHLSKADKSFCPVSVRFRKVPLYFHYAMIKKKIGFFSFCYYAHYAMIKRKKIFFFIVLLRSLRHDKEREREAFFHLVTAFTTS